jgi:hypothetical protein
MNLIADSLVGLRRRQPETCGWATLCCDRPLFDGDVTSGSLGNQYVLGKRPMLIAYDTNRAGIYFSNSVGLSLCGAEVYLLWTLRYVTTLSIANARMTEE